MTVARALRIARALPRAETALLIVASLALVAFGVFKQSVAPKAMPFDSYSSYDAGSGGYRALYELLDREGIRVDRFRSRPAFLDATIDTLLWAEPLTFDPRGAETTAADARALDAWVRAGGRLIYLGSDNVAAARGILHLPVAGDRRAKHRQAASIATVLREAGVASIGPSNGRTRWQTLRRGVRVLVGDGLGPVVVRYRYGRGTVTAFVDETAFANAKIATFDRARLAVALLTPVRAGGTLAFDESIHGFALPRHWWSVVPRAFVVAAALAAFALLVAFTGAAIRLGPPVVPAPRDDRTSADFIDGLASLLQRGGAMRETLAAAAASTSRAAARAFGLDDGASSETIAARIERDDLRAAFREMNALATGGLSSEANLVRGTALAQNIRKEFSAHGP